MKLKQLIALEILVRNEGCLQQELGETLMVDPNNCVLLLNELDDHGYVERQRDPQDRRRHIVVITPAGVKALKKAEAKLETLEGEVLANLDAAERERLGDLLSRAMEGQDPSIDVPRAPTERPGAGAYSTEPKPTRLSFGGDAEEGDLAEVERDHAVLGVEVVPAALLELLPEVLEVVFGEAGLDHLAAFEADLDALCLCHQ